MNQSPPHSIPHEPGRWRALTLAAVVHVALFAFLWFGIRWQNEKPVTVEAEIWSPNAQEAAPVAAQKIPEPQPEPLIEKTPEKVIEKPAPKPVPEPRPVVATPPVAKPDIALEQEKKRKARQLEKEQEQERLAKIRHDKELLDKKLAQKEALKQKELQKEKEALKQAQKEKLEEQAEKEKAQAQKKRAEEEASKAAAAAKEKKRKQELEKKAALAAAAEDARLDKQREENLRRLTGDTSGSGGAGTAAKSQGNRGGPGYGDRIKGKIKSNTIFNVPSDLNGNPATIYVVNLLPDGTIRNLELKKQSGVPGFDEAVKRGIEKSEPYPRDKSGQVPSSFELTYKPKD